MFDIAAANIETFGPLWAECRPDEEDYDPNDPDADKAWLLEMSPQWMYTSDRSRVVFNEITINLFDIWDELIDDFGADAFDVSRDRVSISGEYRGAEYRLILYYEPASRIDFVFGQLEENGWREFVERVLLPPEEE